jgi:hypothetical protein
MYQRPLRSSKVWCGVASFAVVGPYFFEDQNGAAETVTSARCVGILQTFLVPQISCFGRNCGELWWQQMGPQPIQPEHVWRSCVKCFLTASSRNVDIPWPAKSPGLSACDFFLWGYLKGKVYTHRPNNVTVLKQRTEEEIQNIPDDMLRNVMTDVRDRVEKCLRKGELRLTDTVFKKWTQNLCLRDAFVYIIHVEW